MERALPCLQVSEGRSGESTGIWGFNHERSSFKNCSVSRTIGLIILSMFGQNPVPVTRCPYPSVVVGGGAQHVAAVAGEASSGAGIAGGAGTAAEQGPPAPGWSWQPQGLAGGAAGGGLQCLAGEGWFWLEGCNRQ